MKHPAQIQLLDPRILVKTDSRGAVCWSDRWHKIHEAADKGHLRREHHGPSTYGHVTFFYVDGDSESAVTP